MIKGVLWFSLLSLIEAEAWILSGKNILHRPRRQLLQRSTVYLQPLRNAHYLRPLTFPAFREEPGPEDISWVPMRSGKGKPQNRAHRPSLQQPTIIVTRKPQRNTWDIPLSKSIQVSQTRPSVEYIRKNVVRVLASRTTTEHPGSKTLGSLAESTVHTLLNFTPVEEGWRPKGPLTRRPTQVPRYGTKLGTHITKHLNYTGVRFGKVHYGQPKVKLVKNETSFVMRFTPEDIKHFEVKTETDKRPDGVETELEGPGIHRQPFNQHASNHRQAIPVQPHYGRVKVVENEGQQNNHRDSHRSFSKLNTGYNTLLQGPYGTHSKLKVIAEDSGQNYHEPVQGSSQKGNDALSKGLENYFVEPSNSQSTEHSHNKQIQSNLPYQGLQKPTSAVDYEEVNYNGHSPLLNPLLRNPHDSQQSPEFSDFYPFRLIPGGLNHSTGSNEKPWMPHASGHENVSEGSYFTRNRTRLQDTLTVGEMERDKPTKIFKKPGEAGIKSKEKVFSHLESQKYSPQLPSSLNGGELYRHKHQEDAPKTEEETSKPAFDQEPKLSETSLKDPPKSLQFDNFFKPGDSSDFGVPPARNGTVGLKDKVPDKESIKPLSEILTSFGPVATIVKVDSSNRTSADPTDLFFQPMFPSIDREKPLRASGQRFQNYGEPSLESSNGRNSDKKGISTSSGSNALNSIQITSQDAPKEKKNALDKAPKLALPSGVIEHSPPDARKNYPDHLPELIKRPQVITVSYDSLDDLSRTGNANSVHRANRTDSYVIHKKPALVPEGSGKPRKPKITISTGMLAGILIAALVFLGFCTGSMVYAFHQWKFGRGDRQKKTVRTPGFPPEYLDENFAGNTYIHNNIFLPTPQGVEDRTASEQDSPSMLEDEVVPELPPITSRGRRQHRTFREADRDA